METLRYKWPVSATVLLVEDEVIVRLGIAEFLRESGFVVHEASMAAEAIEVLTKGPSIDLLITDVRMPGAMDGFALARWVKSFASDVKVILTSGVVSQGGEGEVVQLVKPYTQEQMLRAIQVMMADHPHLSDEREGAT